MARAEIEEAQAPGRSLTIEAGVLVLSASLLVLVGAVGSLPDRSPRAVGPDPPAALLALPAPDTSSSPTTTCAEELADLRFELRRLRSGAEPQRSGLLALADRVDASCGRSDAARVTRHLLSLTQSQTLAAGAAMDRVQALLDSYAAATGPSAIEHRELALHSLESLAAELDSLADPLPAAYAQRVLAELHLRAAEDSDPQRASAMAERALEIYGRVGFHEQEVEALEVMARAHLLQADLHAARAEATRGLHLARRISDALYESFFLRALVRIADRTGTGLERERLLREWGKIASDPDRCDVEEWWAWTRETVTWLLDEDHPDQAHTLLQDALSQRREAQGADPLASTSLRRQARILEATVLIRAGETERADQLLAQGATYGDHTRLLRAYLNLRLLRQADAQEERTLFAELAVLLSEDWVATLPPELLDQGEIYRGEYHLRRGEPDLARASLLGAVHRALALDRGLASRSSLDETASLGGEVLGLHAVQLLATAYLDLKRPLRAALVIEEMQTRSLRAGAPALRAADLRAWANHNDLGFVTWVLGPDEGVAIWIGDEGRSGSLLIPFGRRAIQRAAGRLSQALRESRAEDAAAIGAELAHSLLPPELLQRLTTCQGESLMLLTHGPLESLPMGALRVPTRDAPDTLLTDAATLRILPGLPAARPGKPPETQSMWILAGAPTDSSGATRLPAALSELLQIADRRPSTLLVGADLTACALIGAFEDSACLHVATHIEWVDTPAGPAPALELADGQLFTVQDLPGQLGARELVILAGCESAGGHVLDGEGVLGFARAFLESGTRGVVATLWPVDDETAHEFGVALHESLLAESPPSAAVRSAARRLRDSGRADWAAFQLLGRD